MAQQKKGNTTSGGKSAKGETGKSEASTSSVSANISKQEISSALQKQDSVSSPEQEKSESVVTPITNASKASTAEKKANPQSANTNIKQEKAKPSKSKKSKAKSKFKAKHKFKSKSKPSKKTPSSSKPEPSKAATVTKEQAPSSDQSINEPKAQEIKANEDINEGTNASSEFFLESSVEAWLDLINETTDVTIDSTASAHNTIEKVHNELSTFLNEWVAQNVATYEKFFACNTAEDFLAVNNDILVANSEAIIEECDRLRDILVSYNKNSEKSEARIAKALERFNRLFNT